MGIGCVIYHIFSDLVARGGSGKKDFIIFKFKSTNACWLTLVCAFWERTGETGYPISQRKEEMSTNKFGVKKFEKERNRPQICGWGGYLWIIERIVESAYGREMIEIRVVLVTRLLVLKHHMPDTVPSPLYSPNIRGWKIHEKWRQRTRKPSSISRGRVGLWAVDGNSDRPRVV